ncbi:MAG: class I SAM-dependent methyltransferase [Chthoniobacterales bacterium]
MNFDRIAPHYRWLETLVFGKRLQQARTAFIRQIETPRHVLVVGEGDGRFLAEFVRAHPGAEVECVEASAQMIELARRREGLATVRFRQADLRESKVESETFDLIVTHFFLDCFDQKELPVVIERLAQSASSKARWLIADFRAPSRGLARWWAQFLIGGMYFFFGCVAGLQTRRLVDYRPLLRRCGFELDRAISPNEIIFSELWERRAPASSA